MAIKALFLHFTTDLAAESKEVRFILESGKAPQGESRFRSAVPSSLSISSCIWLIGFFVYDYSTTTGLVIAYFLLILPVH
jgi:hypothetical protein